VLTYGLEVSANDANRLLGVDAFVTLAKLGQPAQAERLCRLLATFSYLSDAAWAGLTNTAGALCDQLNAIDPQLVHTLLDALLVHPPSPSVWPFLFACSSHCRVTLPSAVLEAYSVVLRGAVISFSSSHATAAGQALLASLNKAGFDLDRRDERGDTLFLELVGRYGNPWLLRTLIDLDAALWMPNSLTKQSALHYWMDRNQIHVVRDILLEEPPWGGLVSRLDWWTADDKGRTPLQMAHDALETSRLRARQNSVYSEGVKTAIEVIDLIAAQHQHWKQTERPLIVQSLVEHASLCTDVAQLVLSYVDGQDRA
jgi:hypothetical protein